MYAFFSHSKVKCLRIQPVPLGLPILGMPLRKKRAEQLYVTWMCIAIQISFPLLLFLWMGIHYLHVRCTRTYREEDDVCGRTDAKYRLIYIRRRCWENFEVRD